MFSYIIRRVMTIPAVILLLTVLLFFLMSFLSPYQLVGLYVTDITQMRGELSLDKLVEQYGLDDPIYIRYFRWLGNLLRGRLGYAASAKMSVSEALLTYIPASVELMIYTLFPFTLIGVILGTIAAVNHDNVYDHLIRIFGVVGYTIPIFVLALLVLMIFYGVVEWFPPGRLSRWAREIVNSAGFVRYTHLNTIDAILNGNLKVFVDAVKHLLGPMLTLMLILSALITRVMRSSMLEIMNKDYITTARAKGMKERFVIAKHALRNAILPVVTIAGYTFARLLGGVVVTETIFNYRGMGLFAVKAAQNLDFPALLGFVLFSGTVLVMVNLIVDLLYTYIDPRIRYT